MPPRRPPIGARRPRLTIAAALVVLLVLGLLGIGVEGKLHAISVNVPGTESSRGGEMLREHFGESAPFAVLLRGPASALDRQGPRLVAALRRADPRVTTVSPWERGGGLTTALRPDRRTALVLVDFHVDGDTAMNRTAPQLEDLVTRNVAAPVRARAAGFATVARAIREESVEVTRRGELILAPILLVVLLLVFRSQKLVQGDRIGRRQRAIVVATRRHHAGGADRSGGIAGLLPDLPGKGGDRCLAAGAGHSDHGFRLLAEIAGRTQRQRQARIIHRQHWNQQPGNGTACDDCGSATLGSVGSIGRAIRLGTGEREEDDARFHLAEIRRNPGNLQIGGSCSFIGRIPARSLSFIEFRSPQQNSALLPARPKNH